MIDHLIFEFVETEEDPARTASSVDAFVPTAVVESFDIVNDKGNEFESAARWPFDKEGIFESVTSGFALHRLTLEAACFNHLDSFAKVSKVPGQRRENIRLERLRFLTCAPAA